MRRGRVGAVVAAVALAGGTLAACGSSKTTAVTTDPLANAYRATQSSKSAKMKLVLSVQSADSSQSVAANGSGAFEWTPLRGQFTISLDAAGQHISLPERLVGTEAYLKLPAAVPQFGNKPWLAVNLTEFVSGTSSTSFDPTEELALLEGQGTVTNLGRQTVDGVSTTAYSATIDPSKPNASVTPEVRQLLQKLEAAGLTSIPVQVWIDSAGRPVRMILTERLDQAPAGAPSAAAAAFPETTKVTMDFSAWGTPVTVSAPLASDVYQITSSELQQLGL